MKLPYAEGSMFAIPLRRGGFAVGVVARTSAAGEVILCYFFGPFRVSAPSLDEVDGVKSSDAILVVRAGDLSLLNGGWPILGQISSWHRSEWPMPAFVRKDELSGKAWKVQYSDSDPGKLDREEPAPYETALPRDALYGSGAVELVLTKMLE